MFQRLLLFLATISYISCDVAPFNPSRSYGAPSVAYGAPLTRYGAPQSSVVALHKRADELPGFQAKTFEDFNREVSGISLNTVSITPPSAEFRLPEAKTSVDFLAPFSTTAKNNVEISSSTAAPLEALQDSVASVGSFQGGALPQLASSIASADNLQSSALPKVASTFASVGSLSSAALPQLASSAPVATQGFEQSFQSQNLAPSTFGRANVDVVSTTYKPSFGVQQDSFSGFNFNAPQQPSFASKGFDFNLPAQNSFSGSFGQSVVSSTVPSTGFDFSAFSTPKPIISEYSNIGINSVPLFNGGNFNTNFFNNDAAINSGGDAVSFIGKTSGGSLTDAFGVSSSTISPLSDSLENLPPVGISQSHNVEVTKNLYFFAAPEEPEEQAQPRVHIPTAPPKKNYKIIFIKTPEFKPAKPVSIPAIPQNEEKTLIYVLQKKPAAPGDIEVQTPPPTAPAKPEVFFIKYKTEKDAQEAVSQVQEAHNAAQIVDNQELIARFGQKNALVPQSFDNANEYQQILAKFGTSTPAPTGFAGFSSTTTPLPSSFGFDSTFGTSTISPLASFTSTTSPLSGFNQFNTFETSSQSPLISSGFKFGQNPSSGFSDFQSIQNAFQSSTPSPVAFKSFETASPALNSFSSFEQSTPASVNIGNQGFGLGINNAPSLGLRSFESISSSAAPSIDTFNSFQSSTPSSVGFDTVGLGVTSSPVAKGFGSFNTFGSPTPAPSGFGSFNLGVTSGPSVGLKGFEGVSTTSAPSFDGFKGFESSTTSPLAFKGFESVSSSVSPGFGSFNLGLRGSFDTSTPSPVGFKSFESSSSGVAPSLSGLSSFESSTPSSLGFKSFEGVSSTVAPAFGGLNSFEASTASPLGGLGGSSFSLSGGISSIGSSAQPESVQSFGGTVPVSVVGGGSVDVVESSTKPSVSSIEVTEKDNAIASNEVEESSSKSEETASASSRHEVYGPPKE